MFVSRQTFKLTLPGKLCQSWDFFGSEKIFTISIEGRRFFEILTWSGWNFTFVSKYITRTLKHVQFHTYFNNFQFVLAICWNLVFCQQNSSWVWFFQNKLFTTAEVKITSTAMLPEKFREIVGIRQTQLYVNLLCIFCKICRFGDIV